MGGCRCSYKSCRNTTKTTQNIHFFHYPVKQKERCKAWINRAGKPKFFDLDEYQLRNKVICEVHFEDSCFLNSERKRLLPQAIPTLDGEFQYEEPNSVAVYTNVGKERIKKCPKSPKMGDIQVLPANEDGTVFVLDTFPSYKVNKEVKSYILNEDALFPIEKKHESIPRIKEEPEYQEHDQGEYILSDNNYFPNIQHSTPLKKLPSSSSKQARPDYEILNSDSSPQMPSPAKTMTKEALESIICNTVESKYLHKLEQHTKDLNQIKKALKLSSNKRNQLNKTSVLRYLKLRLPPSLNTLINLSLNEEYELNEDDENFFKNLHDSSSKTYQFLSEDCGWRMPIIEIHEGDAESMDEC
ncbi:uncharacterized protein LOC123316638 [Coccinella septempunctata]|uniref:uncharacterized protein LOC123316638 n=1 Tax=Coccinella septempunctata TaxID=41139 RepID=UPI001D08AB11|nr:uncharacterized protein LOC123316638 [Coccinella septempunctata]